MTFTASQVKAIGQELNKLKPPKIPVDGNRMLTLREAIFALAPTLERMKKRGFEPQEIIQRLQEKNIEIKAGTLARYLNEYRRGKDKKKESAMDKKNMAPQTQSRPSIHEQLDAKPF